MPGSQGTCSSSLLTRLPRELGGGGGSTSAEPSEEADMHPKQLPSPCSLTHGCSSRCYTQALPQPGAPAIPSPPPIPLLSQTPAFLRRVGNSSLNTVVCGLAEQWEIGFALQAYPTINPQEQRKGLMDQSRATGFHPFRSSPNPAAPCPCALPGASDSFPSDCWTSLR